MSVVSWIPWYGEFLLQSVPDYNPVYAYDQKIEDFRFFATVKEWEEHFTVSGAISYLKKHLQQSLKDDFYTAYEACYQKGVGFFALPRIVFPYITFLGTLIGGKDSSTNAVDYMTKYLSKANQTFGEKELCKFIYWVYRHGLAHTNMPKVAAENGKVFGWRIVFDDRQHLEVDKNPSIDGKSALLSISPRKLADEVIFSIDEYIQDLQTGVASFSTFKNGFLSMAKIERRKIPDYLK